MEVKDKEYYERLLEKLRNSYGMKTFVTDTGKPYVNPHMKNLEKLQSQLSLTGLERLKELTAHSYIERLQRLTARSTLHEEYLRNADEFKSLRVDIVNPSSHLAQAIARLDRIRNEQSAAIKNAFPHLVQESQSSYSVFVKSGVEFKRVQSLLKEYFASSQDDVEKVLAEYEELSDAEVAEALSVAANPKEASPFGSRVSGAVIIIVMLVEFLVNLTALYDFALDQLESGQKVEQELKSREEEPIRQVLKRIEQKLDAQERACLKDCRIASDNLNIYQSMSTKSNIVIQVPSRTVLFVEKKEAHWMRVSVEQDGQLYEGYTTTTHTLYLKSTRVTH